MIELKSERATALPRRVASRVGLPSKLAVVTAMAAAALLAFWPFSVATAEQGAKTVVLVHGSWADGSSWNKVIPLLRAKGLNVVAIQNPLSSLKDDVDAATRAIDMQAGPVILVGHSWGGVVISQAGNNDKVKALVYVAAFAPDSGQSINDVIKGLPDPPYLPTLGKDERGFLYLSPESVERYFAPDLPPATRKTLIATQGPWFYGCLADKVTKAAWHDKPSWWVLSEKDRIIDPRLQQAMATAAKSNITRVQSSHVAMLSKPAEVANVIVAAAASVQ